MQARPIAGARIKTEARPFTINVTTSVAPRQKVTDRELQAFWKQAMKFIHESAL